MEYTEKVHAERLLKMLKKKDPCMCCPAQPYFKTETTFGIDSIELDSAGRRGACKICQDFIGIRHDCPCCKLKKEEALKRTWLALEAKGYI